MAPLRQIFREFLIRMERLQMGEGGWGEGKGEEEEGSKKRERGGGEREWRGE